MLLSEKKKKCWLAPSCQFIGDSMASKGNVILKPALAPSETCSHFTFELQGSHVSSQLLPHHQWTHSHEWGGKKLHVDTARPLPVQPGKKKTPASEDPSFHWTSSRSRRAEMHFTIPFISKSKETAEDPCLFIPTLRPRNNLFRENWWRFFWGVGFSFYSCCCLCSPSLFFSHGRRAGAGQNLWQVKMF